MKKRFADQLAIGDVLKAFVSENNLESGLLQVKVEEIWTEQLGPAIKKYTTKIYLKNETLYVQLSSSVLREELSYGKQKIIKMINESLGKEYVKELVLK